MSLQEHVETWRLLPPEEVGGREVRKEAAIWAAQGTPGTRAQQVRLSINFHITFAGSPPDDDGLNEPDPASHARQARLLTAVGSNPAVLQQWLSRLIVEQMRQKGWAYWDRLTGGEIAFQDMLSPALAALSEDDQAYFAEVATGESFEDLIDLFSASLTVTEESPRMTERGDEYEYPITDTDHRLLKP